jgi:hypothetical protein
MNEMEMMQLSRLLNALVGEPPHRVTVGAVRRKVVKRRLIASVAATAAAALAGSVGLLASAHALGKHPAMSASPRATEPRYYFEVAIRPRSGHLHAVVRSTATGAMTAQPHCPGPDPYLSAVATAGQQTFFIACLQNGRHGLTGTRLYRFALTRSGRVTGFRLLTSGNLSGLRGGALAASPDGAELAVGIAPARSGPLSDILVINTMTGKHVVWHAAHLPGGINFSVQDLSFARNGQVLAVFGWGRCPKTAAERTCQSPGQEMVAVSHAAAGGRLASGRVLFTLPSLTPDRRAWINDAFIEPDGATAIAAVSGSTGSSVVRVSTATGKPSGVLYRARSNLVIRPDPSGRFVLVVGFTLRGDLFGWIDHGHLAPLKPAAQVIYLEAW